MLILVCKDLYADVKMKPLIDNPMSAGLIFFKNCRNSGLITLMDQREAFSTGHGFPVIGSNAFRMGTKRSLLIAWIVQYHSVFAECM